MYKVYFLLRSQGDPFRYRGDEALAAVQKKFPQAVGYVQSRTLPEPEADAVTPPYAGAAELWFRQANQALDAGSEDLTGILAAHAVQKSCLVGMERVVMRLPSHLTEQHIKGIFPFRRKRGMDPEAFQHYWWHNHGPIAAFTEAGLCYIQIHRLLHSENRDDQVIDGITEIHWPDRGSADKAMQSPHMREDQGNDADNFVDRESVELFFVAEEIIIAP